MDLTWREVFKLGLPVAFLGTIMAFLVGAFLNFVTPIWAPLPALIYFVLFFVGSMNLSRSSNEFTEIFSLMLFLWFVAGVFGWIFGMVPSMTSFVATLGWMQVSATGLIQMLVYTVASLGIIGMFKR